MAHELCARHRQTLAKATQELESKIEDKTVFLSIIQQVRLPSVQIHGQNGGRNRTTGRPDIQRTDSETTPAKHQEDLLLCNRPNQDDGSLHVLCPVREDHRPEGITDWMQQRFQMPRNPVQETGDWEGNSRVVKEDPVTREARGRWKRSPN